jgi:diguanylate cyclase (GGDEF)-like protein/PAS domain S-box-containing protein
VNPIVVSFLLPYLAAAVISASVAVFALRWRALPGAGPFAALALAEALWAGAYLLQRISPDLSGQLFWNSIQLTATLVSALGYLGFALAYTRRKLRNPLQLWSGLAFLALLIAGLIWSDSLIHLFRSQPHLAPAVPFSRLVFQDGPTFFIFTLFVYGLIAFSTFLLASNFFSSPSIYRVQIGTVLIGVFVPWAISLLSFTGLIAIPLHDITPIAFAPSNLLMLWALFRYHLFEVAPIARDTLVERMRDGVIVLDRRRRIIDFNPAAREILSLSNTETPGKFIGRALPALHKFVIHLTETPNARAEVSIDVMGMPSRFEVSATPLYDNLGSITGYLVILRDVTEQKRTEEKLHLMALTDYLTGILNRRAFFELAGPELERSRRYNHSLAFILLDVDNFKKVNDTYGHLVGDKVLQEMARICQQSLREVDRFARYGGEEFIAMLPETTLDGAQQTAERLRSLVDCTTVNTRQGSVKITTSLGVVVFQPTDELTTLDRLLGQADQALYQAKRLGRNQVCVWQDEQPTYEV